MGTELRRRRRLSDLLGLASFACPGLASLALACWAWPAATAHAQQVTTPNGSVTIDYGVLNALGGQGQAPGVTAYGQPYPAYAQSPYTQSPYAPPVSPYGQPAYPYPYGQPAYGYPAQGAGQVLYPPPQYPVSSLLVPAPMGSTPYVPSVAAVQPTQPMTPPATTEPAVPAPAATAPASTATAPPAPSTTASATSDTNPPPPPPPSAVPGAATITAPPPPSTTTTATAEPPSAPSTNTTAPPASTDNSAASVAPPAPPPAEGSSGTAATGSGGIAPPAAPDSSGGIAPPSAPAASGNTQTAAIPPAAPVEGQIQIAFPADSADIPDAAKAELDTLAQKMSADDNLRLQLLAYASGTADEASRARRMSLSRALAVRSYLIKAGVRSTRMDVRALGNNVQGSPADRVDIIPKAT
jgi:outer membrane protein OmpA-like peptidoglycan-associated protein